MSPPEDPPPFAIVMPLAPGLAQADTGPGT